MTQANTSRYIYILFLFTLTFGILLYNLIGTVLGFDYTDEVCALFLFVLYFIYLFQTKSWEINKAFLTTLLLFIFYLCYSLFIHSNTVAGIGSDFFIQIKPYLAFFCVYSMAPKFDKHQKTVLRSVALLYWMILFFIGLSSLFYPDIIKLIMFHPTFYAAAVICTSLCYFYYSRFTSLDKLIFLLMLSIGILSGRSKFYGFFALSVFVILFFLNTGQIKWNVRNILIVVCMFAAVVFVAWEKIFFYFYQAVTEDVEKDMIARYILYATAPDILRDYFPFGSGFASYATYASGVYYSRIYADYGIDGVWGLSRSYYSFIADTYYPSLVQFGVAGMALYLLFWIYLFRKALFFYRRTQNQPFFIIIILLIAYLAIEGTTDSTFVSNRGFFVMMLMGIVLVDMKRQYYSYFCHSQKNN
ncbi:MAG: O-antigen ligase domain-containing protein [Tannerellaceae bacterium]|nr:O-antigen ligase domain-containing protein [Tannerellaceae bacterium]